MLEQTQRVETGSWTRSLELILKVVTEKHEPISSSFKIRAGKHHSLPPSERTRTDANKPRGNSCFIIYFFPSSLDTNCATPWRMKAKKTLQPHPVICIPLPSRFFFSYFSLTLEELGKKKSRSCRSKGWTVTPHEFFCFQYFWLGFQAASWFEFVCGLLARISFQFWSGMNLNRKT